MNLLYCQGIKVSVW